MSDTRANQKVYPQHSNQKPGCGFPLAQLVVWFCGRTGAVLDIAIASFKTSEWQLSRQLYATLTSDDVVVADSAIGHPLIRLRPERAEPRVVKRRPKGFPRMQQSRAVFNAQCVAARSA